MGLQLQRHSREPDLPNHGELCALYVRPEYWGREVLLCYCIAKIGPVFGTAK